MGKGPRREAPPALLEVDRGPKNAFGDDVLEEQDGSRAGSRWSRLQFDRKGLIISFDASQKFDTYEVESRHIQFTMLINY